MRQLFIFIFCVISLTSFAQSIENGIVKEYRESKKKVPLAGVELIVSNAGSNISDQDGKFTLTFRTLAAGDKVDVRKIEKKGYEIFNKDALDAWRISNNGAEFSIILCKSSKFKALKDQYYVVASKSYAEQQKKDEERLAFLLNEGKLQQAEYESKLKTLKDHYDEQLEKLDNYIDRFARIDLETISVEENKIIDFIKQGKIDEAITMYESMCLENKYAQVVNNIYNATSAINQLENVRLNNENDRHDIISTINRMNDTRRLQGGEDNYKKIAESLKFIADQDTTYYSVVYQYASFAHEQKLFEDAVHYYNICYNLMSGNLMKQAELARTIGALMYDKKEYNNSMEWYSKCSNICLQDTILYRDEYARLNINLSNLNFDLRNFSNSISCAKHALFLFNLQENTDSIILYSNLCRTYNALSNSYRELKDYENSIECSNQAISFCNILLNVDSVCYSPDFALMNHNLGYTYNLSGSHDKAIEVYNRVIEIRERLVQYNPARYSDDLALSYLNLGTVYYVQQKFNEAEELFLKSYNMFLNLQSSYPTTYLPQLAMSLSNLGALYCETNHLDKAELFMKDALKCKRELYTINSKSYIWSLIITYYNLGNLYHNKNCPQLCIDNILEGFGLLKNIYDTNKDIYRSSFIEMSIIAIENAMKINNYELAIKLSNDAIQESPDNQKIYYKLALCHLYLGNTQLVMSIIEKLNEIEDNFTQKNQNTYLIKQLKERGLLK